MSSELARVALLRELFAAAAPSHLRLGIGDDAAVLVAPPPPEEIVWTVDASVEGVHFQRDWLSLEDIGYRATMAAASDLAAMGARPLGLLAALVLPPWMSDADLSALARGQRQAADELGTVIAGGNLARGSELSITTTALGSTPRPLPRGGARPGDVVWLAGPVGLAGAGLVALSTGANDAALAPAVHAWRRPRARLRDGLAASVVASAAIDVSDGLAQDVGHLARASGASVVLDASTLASAELRAAAAVLGRDALDLALRGGEDYALVVTAARGQALEGFTRIGEVEASEAGPSVTLRHEDGRREPVEGRGFDHFASA